MTNKTAIVVTKWNIGSLIGWANIVLGILALLPAALGYGVYFIWGGVLGLLIGGVYVTISGPLKIKETHYI